jgi:hypothetical protein
MSTRSKSHHYVSQGLLKKFAYSGSKVWYFSKRKPENGVCSRDIEKIFRKRHYYTITTHTGQRSDALERDFLQVLDSRFVVFVDSLTKELRSGHRPRVDGETADFLRQFVYFHAKRNPDFEAALGIIGNAGVHVTEAMESFERKFGPVSTERREKLLQPENVADIYQYARVSAYATSSTEVSERLAKMLIHFAFPPANKQLLIGSRPVVRFENRRGARLGDGHVELWTAIYPNVLERVAVNRFHILRP